MDYYWLSWRCSASSGNGQTKGPDPEFLTLVHLNGKTIGTPIGWLKKLVSSDIEMAPEFEVHPEDEDLITGVDDNWCNRLTLSDLTALNHEDNGFRLALFQTRLEEGLSSTEAARRVRKDLVHYYLSLEGRAEDPNGFGGEDAKLPYALKGRVNDIVMRQLAAMDKKEVKAASSMNALIRSLIRG